MLVGVREGGVQEGGWGHDLRVWGLSTLEWPSFGLFTGGFGLSNGLVFLIHVPVAPFRSYILP
eukprot:6241758-Pyramimonas_sp.AAC.1